MSIVHYSLVKDQSKVGYDDLSDAAKCVARDSVHEDALIYANDYLRVHKSLNRNAAINDRRHFKAGMANRFHANRCAKNVPYFESHIRGNLCEFLIDGSYVVYSDRHKPKVGRSICHNGDVLFQD